MDPLTTPPPPPPPLHLTGLDLEEVTADAILHQLRSPALRDAEVCPAHFLAAVLEAQGLTCWVRHQGHPGDRDVLARDGVFGTGPNRWFCRVLEAEVASEADVREFLADLPERRCGILVSLGGFERSAEALAEQADVRTVGGREFVALLIKHNACLGADLSALIPLQGPTALVGEG
jgi:predicted Mrr-cat superfamily restriction endonuclease